MKNNCEIPRNIKVRNGKYYVNVVKNGVDHYGGTHYTLDEAKAALEALYRALGINPKFKPQKINRKNTIEAAENQFCDTKFKKVIHNQHHSKKMPKTKDLFNANLPKGIYINKHNNKYQAYVCVNNRLGEYIGTYNTMEEAIEEQKKGNTMYINKEARDAIVSKHVLSNELQKVRTAIEKKEQSFQPDRYIDRLIVVNMEEMMDTFDIVTITPYAVLDELHFKMNMLSTLDIRNMIGTFVREEKSGCDFLVERINVEGKHLKYYVKYFPVKNK